MRILLTCLLAGALVAPAALAHLTATPSFVADGGETALVLDVPNERPVTMTAFEVALPAGLRAVSARSGEGWDVETGAQRVSWTGGTLAPGGSHAFRLTVRAAAEPGPLPLRAVQRFADGRAARWSVEVLVVPGAPDEGGSGRVVAAGLAGAAVVLASVAAVLVLRRRSTPPGTPPGAPPG